MNIISSFFSSVSGILKPHTVKDDMALAEKIAKEDARHSVETIRRALYIKAMAEAKLAAINQWRANEEAILNNALKGVSNDRPSS